MVRIWTAYRKVIHDRYRHILHELNLCLGKTFFSRFIVQGAENANVVAVW